jgi:hypothetical protein
VFAVLFVASFFAGGDIPGADDPGGEVLSFYTDNQSVVMVGSVMVAIAAVFFLFFVGHVRSFLRAAEGSPGTLSAVAAGGGIVAATGLLIFAGIGFTLSESIEGFEPATAQALNALNANFFFPLAGGIATFLLATGLVAMRTKALPAWLAWLAIVIAVLAFSPLGFFAFLGSILWVLVVSIVLWTKQSAPVAPPT